MGERTLEDIKHDHWLAGHEQTGGMRREWYGGKGWQDIEFLLSLVATPMNRKARRAETARRRIQGATP